MVYTRVLFNNIKEYTPSFIKTIPRNQITRKVLQRKPPLRKLSKSNKVFYYFMSEWVMKGQINYRLFLFFLTVGMTNIFWMPSLFLHKHNNRHRQLEVAVAIEKEHQKKLAEMEDDDEDEDEEEDEE